MIRTALSALLPVSLFLSGCSSDPEMISLEGNWQFQIDSLDQGIGERWYDQELDDKIRLPGSMAGNGKGNDIRLDMEWTGSIYDSSWYFSRGTEKYRKPDKLYFPMWLTPVKHYSGPAWYRREINIPESWKGRRLVLFLERVHTESRLWVDGRQAGMRHSLVAPHVYDLSSLLTPGRHILALRIDNRIETINVGPDSHSITDHTQGNWNGVIGRMELRSDPPVWIGEVRAYPDPGAHSARIRIRVGNMTGAMAEGSITISAESYNADDERKVGPVTHPFAVDSGKLWLDYNLDMGTDFLRWDEFSPALYRLHVRLASEGGGSDDEEISFGMRTFDTSGTRFSVNGRPVFLRGNVNCAAFPLTGHPPMDLASWKRIFGILKAYGLNHVRYHSWCPPRAAFEAADLAGFYLQPEGPSWPNHGVSLGDGLPVDTFIYEEVRLMERWYGNHPSWVMLACGNEPAGRHQAEYLGRFVNYWKERDPRRVYTGASVGSRWPDVPQAEYIVRSNPRGLPWRRQRPSTTFDHRAVIREEVRPWVSHEIGQYCAFPDFGEIKDYTGVMKPRNLEMFRGILRDHDMGDEAEDFLMASGKLQLLCYKNEIEAAMRTPGFAGFQMLSLNDFPGQGTALVGILTAMYREKGYAGPDDFSKFCGPVVPLARIPKFTYTGGERFTATLELFNFGKGAISDARVDWKITNTGGKVLFSGDTLIESAPLGNNIPAGHVDLSLPDAGLPQKMNLEVGVAGTGAHNEWDFWVYPAKLPEITDDETHVCSTLDSTAMQVLDKGGRVLILSAGHIERGRDVVMYFTPVFWNTSWFRMRPPHVTGIFCREDHPVFRDFPTTYHTDLQWWGVQNRQQVMQLDRFPQGFRPLIQPIDTWFLSRKLGTLLEAKVSNGKLMVCSIDLKTDTADRPVARQLLYSIRKYMGSPEFEPQFNVDPQVIRSLFRPAGDEPFDAHTASTTDELVPVTN